MKGLAIALALFLLLCVLTNYDDGANQATADDKVAAIESAHAQKQAIDRIAAAYAQGLAEGRQGCTTELTRPIDANR